MKQTKIHILVNQNLNSIEYPYLSQAMKWKLSPMFIWVAIALPGLLEAQRLPDFTDAKDFDELSVDDLYDFINTQSHTPATIDLRYLQDEFPEANEITLTTFYREDVLHPLFRISKGVIPLHNNYLRVNRNGENYFHLSDGICDLFVYYKADDVGGQPALHTKVKNCIY